jgi:hypothetical protein
MRFFPRTIEPVNYMPAIWLKIGCPSEMSVLNLCGMIIGMQQKECNDTRRRPEFAKMLLDTVIWILRDCIVDFIFNGFQKLPVASSLWLPTQFTQKHGPASTI